MTTWIKAGAAHLGVVSYSLLLAAVVSRPAPPPSTQPSPQEKPGAGEWDHDPQFLHRPLVLEERGPGHPFTMIQNRPAGVTPGYTTPAAQALLYGTGVAEPGVTAEKFDQLVDSVKEIRDIMVRFGSVPAGGQGQPAAAQLSMTPADKLKAAQVYCAGCHTPKNADEKGAGFVLFTDEDRTALKPVSRSARKAESELVRRKVVVEKSMPPGDRKKPTPAEAEAAFGGLWD